MMWTKGANEMARVRGVRAWVCGGGARDAVEEEEGGEGDAAAGRTELSEHAVRGQARACAALRCCAPEDEDGQHDDHRVLVVLLHAAAAASRLTASARQAQQ